MSKRVHALGIWIGVVVLALSLGYAVASIVRVGATAWTGVQFNPGTSGDGDLSAVLSGVPGFRPGSVTQLYPGAPGDLAGVRAGDLVVAVDGIPVSEHDRLRRRSRELRVGETVEFRVRRGDRILDLAVRLDSPLRAPAYLFSIASSWVVALAFAVTGLIVALKKRGDRRAFLFFLISFLAAALFLGASSSAALVLTGLGMSDPEAIGVGTLVILVALSVLGSLFWPMLLHFSLVFPKERPVLVRRRSTLAWVYGLAVLQLVVIPALWGFASLRKLVPGVDGGPAAAALLALGVAAAVGVSIGLVRSIRARGWKAAVPDHPWRSMILAVLIACVGFAAGLVVSEALSVSRTVRVVLTLGLPFVVVAALILGVLFAYPISACVSLYRSYRESGPEEKAQVRWPLWGIILALGGITVTGLLGLAVPFTTGTGLDLPGVWFEGIGKVFYLLIPLSFAFGILKYRLMDIELVLRKTVTYSVLTGAVLVVYLVLAGGLGGLLVRFAGVQSQWIVIAATLVVAAALVPVRNQVQSFVDRRFFRHGVDYARALQAIVEGADRGDAGELARVIAEQVQQAMGSRAVVVFTGAEDDAILRAVAKVGLPDEALERLAIDRGDPVLHTTARVLDLSSSDLPPQQRRIVRDARTALLAPIRRGKEILGALSVGSKLSGAPMDPGDREFCARVADQAALALENLRLRRHGAEAGMALEIQRHLLPKSIPRVAGLEIAAHWQPSSTVAGDYYDVLRLDDRRIGVCIADAAGKGMPAALMMSNLQAAVRALAPSSESPSRLCRQLNDIICGSVAAGKYLTFFYCELDTGTGRLRYCNAGHNPPILVRADGLVERLAEGGMVLGAFPDRTYREGEAMLGDGDRLVLFTDGITEAEGPGGAEFGERRLLDLVRERRGDGAAAVQDAVTRAVREFHPGENRDDATLVVLAVGSNPAA